MHIYMVMIYCCHRLDASVGSVMYPMHIDILRYQIGIPLPLIYSGFIVDTHTMCFRLCRIVVYHWYSPSTTHLPSCDAQLESTNPTYSAVVDMVSACASTIFFSSTQFTNLKSFSQEDASELSCCEHYYPTYAESTPFYIFFQYEHIDHVIQHSKSPVLNQCQVHQTYSILHVTIDIVLAADSIMPAAL